MCRCRFSRLGGTHRCGKQGLQKGALAQKGRGFDTEPHDPGSGSVARRKTVQRRGDQRQRFAVAPFDSGQPGAAGQDCVLDQSRFGARHERECRGLQPPAVGLEPSVDVAPSGRQAGESGAGKARALALRQGHGQRPGEGVGGGVGDAGHRPPVVEQPEAEQPSECGLRRSDAVRRACGRQGRQGDRHLLREQGGGGELAGLVRCQGGGVGGEGQPAEEGDQRVVAVLGRAGGDQRPDLGRRRAVFLVFRDLAQRRLRRRVLAGQDRRGQHCLQARIARRRGERPGEQRLRRLVVGRVLLPGEPLGGAELLLPVPRRHRRQRRPRQVFGQVAAATVGQAEVVAAGEQQP